MKFKDLLLHNHNDNFNHANLSQGILEFYSKGNILFKDRDVARRLIKARHNLIEGRSLVVKVPGESKVERPWSGADGRGEGVPEYATERHSNEGFKTFFSNPKLMFRHVPSQKQKYITQI